ncbi:galactose mutarotase-like domain-containing protein [Chytridium lagenaria]|nr:galactose mutarotase-like domain-containing protein [Chytridium lagenaria]
MTNATQDVTLTSPSTSIQCTIRPHGATISHLLVKDPVSGKVLDVVQGFDTLEQQLESDKGANPYYGTIGRVCNRIANGTFTLNSKTYTLPINNGPNSLHGGLQGFDKKTWSILSSSSSHISLSLLSPANQESYPCDLLVTITYTLTDSSLLIDYTAKIPTPTTDETIVNLTTHSYFNLSGRYNDNPTLDFSSPKPFNQDLESVMEFKGYDHFFVVKNAGDAKCVVGEDEDVVMVDAATLVSPDSGLEMKLRTSAMGFQLYTGNWLDGSLGPKSTQECKYGPYSGVCLEASAPPDAVNSKDGAVRALVVLGSGKVWKQKTEYGFKFLGK